jgi:hypothetical protein
MELDVSYSTSLLLFESLRLCASVAKFLELF